MNALASKLLGILVVISSVLFTGWGSNEVIVSPKTEKEANEIIVLLSTKGINGTKDFVSNDQGGSWKISVPQTQRIEAINIVTIHGYPKDAKVDIIKEFSSSGLMRSPQDDQARYQRILEKQLSNTLQEFDGILYAEVNISVHQNINMNDASSLRKTANYPLKASVYIKHTGVLEEPGSQHIPKIKKLVASRLIGLEAENVYVIAEKASELNSHSFLGSVTISRELQKETSILGIKFNVESVKKVRIVVTIFVVLLVLLTLMLMFFIWKALPAILNNWKTLFSFKQLQPQEKDSDVNKVSANIKGASPKDAPETAPPKEKSENTTTKTTTEKRSTGDQPKKTNESSGFDDFDESSIGL